MAKPETAKTRYRTLWISDVHLGTRDCKAEHLVDFLKRNECEQLYLVGDIIDGWKLRQQFFWPQEHTNVIRRILTQSKRGTKVTYVTGNHDEFLRKFVDYRLSMGNITVVNEAIHTTADGRKLLVIHGDFFDVITRYHRWIALAGDTLYEGTMTFNLWFSRARRLLGMRYWSLSAFAKQHVKTAVSVVTSFEDSLVRECKRRGLHGVVKVLTVPGKDRILGVTIAGEHAGDLIAEYVLAMRHGIGLNKILGTIHIYPTLAEMNKYAAGNWKKAHAPQGVLKWVEKLHAWRRN